ncbi:MAG: hypothetical protein P8N63_00710 [Pseudomonadales bacterium]|nr:hypothetical protein [Pseudomonadales bacterium]
MEQLLSVETQSNAAPMELNLARILRASLSADQGRLAGLPDTIILKDTKTRLKLRLVITPDTGITVSRAGKKETALVEGLFDPFVGAPPTFELRGAWRKPLLKRRLEQLFQPTLTPWQTAAENFYTASSLLDPNEFTVESYSEDTDSRHCWGQGSEHALILGSAATLSHLYNGYALLIDDILKGRIQCQASMRTIAIITDATTNHWMDLQ